MVGLVAVVASLAVAGPAFAQKPSAADIDEMLPAPPDSHAFPSYKWASDAPHQAPDRDRRSKKVLASTPRFRSCVGRSA